MSGTHSAVDAFETLLGLRTIVDVALHPDGDQVAYVVEGDADSICVQRIGGATRRVRLEPGLTPSSVTWTDDGTAVLVVAGAVQGCPDRLLAVDPDSGAAHRVVRVVGAIEDVVLSGTHVVLRVADPGSERDGMHLGIRVPSVDPGAALPVNPLRRLVRVTSGGESESVAVPLPGFTVWDHDIDEAGRVLAVVSWDPRPAGYYHAELVLTDLDGADLRVLLSGRGQLARPRLARDGRTAYVVEGRSIVSGRVLQIDLETSTVRVAPQLDDVTDLGMLDDGSVWFCGWHGTGTHVGTLDTDLTITSHAVMPGTLAGRDGQPRLSVATSGRLAAVGDDAVRPAEILIGDIGDDGHWQPITELNADLSDLTASLTREQRSWTSADGTRVDGLLIRRADATDPSPLVVMLHGGPTWLWSNSFAPAESNGLAVPLALAGAAVLLPNPRGSSGRGQAYADAIAGHVGELDVQDVVAGVDSLVTSGIADHDRMAVLGLSYGGYLSAWLATCTDLFRASVVMSGVADWPVFARTSNLAGGFDAAYFPGVDPGTSEGRTRLAAVSPARHARATIPPTLVLHGAEDRVTPLDQAQELASSWEAAGCVVDLVVYPREGHELVEPDHRRDATRRVVDWLHRCGVLG